MKMGKEKEMLRQQLELLEKRSETCDDASLASISRAMYDIVTYLDETQLTAPIRTEEEFAAYLNSLKKRVVKYKEDGLDYGDITCGIVGNLRAEKHYAITPEQLERIFGLRSED